MISDRAASRCSDILVYASYCSPIVSASSFSFPVSSLNLAILASSTLFARYTPPASAPIATVAMPTGDANAAVAADNMPVLAPADVVAVATPSSPSAAVLAADAFPNFSISLPTPVVSPAMPFVAPPATLSTGPSAAANAAVLTMAFCCPAGRLLNFSARPPIAFMASVTTGRIWVPASIPAFLSLFNSFCILAAGVASIFSNASWAVPAESCIF